MSEGIFFRSSINLFWSVCESRAEYTPVSHFLEALLVRNVVAQNPGIRSSIIKFADAPKPFLACGVPYLEADSGIAVRVDQALRNERSTDRTWYFCCRKSVVDIANN